MLIPVNFNENFFEMSVELPAKFRESPPMIAPSVSVTMKPSRVIPLGSVACTRIESDTSARNETVCSTRGGVTSFATD